MSAWEQYLALDAGWVHEPDSRYPRVQRLAEWLLLVVLVVQVLVLVWL